MYGFSVKIKHQFNTYTWELVHPTGEGPYMYDTKEEALAMMRMCYPQCDSTEVKVVEL
jgi:hypothetical protein